MLYRLHISTMIAKKFASSLLLLHCCFGVGMCSDCTYIEGDYHYQDNVYTGYHGICTGVTSDLSLDPNPPNASTVNILYIEGNSTIPHLEASSTFSSLISLKYLALKKIQIETISPGAFNGLSNLIDLSLNFNKIKEIAPGIFSDVKNLQKLFISKNELSKISAGAFADLKSLQHLDLSKNRISHIEDGALSDLVSLETLDIDNNNINTLQANLFQNLKSLNRFFVSNNPLSDWQDVGFGPKVGVIIASNNSLTSFNLNLSRLSLSHFDLSSGQLNEFDFANLGRVSNVVKLENNHISVLKNFESSDAHHVDLDKNDLAEIKNIPPSLVGLSLSRNKITKIERVQASRRYKLQFLDLSFNQLDSFKCAGFRQLKTLTLSHNDISVVDPNSFSGCRRLRELVLASNKIESLEPNIFKNLTLKTFDISNNSLKNFDGANLGGLTNLETLLLHDNRISTLDVKRLGENVPNLKEVKLGGNPFTCEEWQSIASDLQEDGIKVLDKKLLESSRCN